jgi:hypothetical protein
MNITAIDPADNIVEGTTIDIIITTITREIIVTIVVTIAMDSTTVAIEAPNVEDKGISNTVTQNYHPKNRLRRRITP